MKFPIDLVLISLLIVLMYYQPDILTSLTTSVLGRMVAVCLVAHIALAYGRNAGLLAALIFILLLHNKREGFATPKPSAAKGSAARKKKKTVKEAHTANADSPSPTPAVAAPPAAAPPAAAPAPTPAPAAAPPAPAAAAPPAAAPAGGKGKPQHPLGKLTNPKTGGLSIPSKAAVKERIQNIINKKHKKKVVPVTQTNKTDLENKLQREPHINSQAAKGEHGGVGLIKSIKR